jgi:LysM repeat protein
MRQLIFTTLFVFLVSITFASPNGKFVYHTVEKGETLYSISHMYGLKPVEVAQYNETIGDKLTIHIGQKIKIPASDADAGNATSEKVVTSVPAAAAQTHIVAKGETIFSISKLYNVPKTDLIAWNRIKDNSLAVGQKLTIKSDANAISVEKSHAGSASEPVTAKADMQKAMKKDGYLWTLPGNPKSSKSNVSTASGDVTASTSAVGLADSKTVKSWKAESANERHEYYNSKTNISDPAAEYESLYYQNIYSGMTKKSETGVAKFQIATKRILLSTIMLPLVQY